MDTLTGSTRASQLEVDLEAAAEALITVLERIDADLWMRVPGPSTWSIGKVAAHVADTAGYHQSDRRLTDRETVRPDDLSSRRTELTTSLTPRQTVDLIRERTDRAQTLILNLTDAQLSDADEALTGWRQALADTIALVLVDSLRHAPPRHRADELRDYRAHLDM